MQNKKLLGLLVIVACVSGILCISSAGLRAGIPGAAENRAIQETIQPSNSPTTIASPTQTSVPRWMIYEKALSKAIVGVGNGLCEWEIYGKAEHEVYVWAECRVREPIGTAGSVPAVIRLAENGEIENVIIPRDGANYPIDVRALFPADIQEKIFNLTFNGRAAEEHIDERLKTNGPPLIVLAGTALP